MQEEPVTVVSPNTFKLNRRPGRWQYKSSPKPKVNIRKNSNPNVPTTIQNDTLLATDPDTLPEIITNQAINNGRDLEASGSQNGPVANNNEEANSKYFVQTLNVEISTPQPFIDTYYEIATIKTPFIFQVRYISFPFNVFFIYYILSLKFYIFYSKLNRNIIHFSGWSC